MKMFQICTKLSTGAFAASAQAGTALGHKPTKATFAPVISLISRSFSAVAEDVRAAALLGVCSA